MAYVVGEHLRGLSSPGSVSPLAGSELRKRSTLKDSQRHIPLERRATRASVSGPSARCNNLCPQAVTRTALGSESASRRQRSQGQSSRGVLSCAAESSSGDSSRTSAEPEGSASVGVLDSEAAEQPDGLSSAGNGTSTSEQGLPGVPGSVSTDAPGGQETQASTPAAAKPSSGSVPYFPMPSFMAEQVAAEAASLELAPAETEAEAEARTKRKAPSKLPLQDKATAPWGWEPGTGREEVPLGALEQWLRTKGLPEQRVALGLVKEGGRGLVAQRDIGQGEALLFVPSQLMMTAEEMYETAPAGPILKQAGVPEWPALAVFLLLEAGKGKQSAWSTYIATLPKTPPCILQWSPEEVDVLLQGSPVQRKAIECIADVTTTFQDLDALVFSKHREVFPEELFTLGLFKWAFAVLFSRLVRLPSLGGKLALVPWADMLNHRCEVESYLDYDSWKKAVVFKTDRKYSAGKEVFASYGPRSNGSLLLAYGVVPTTRNPHDSVDITLGLDPADPALGRKAAALQRRSLASPLSFPLRMEGWPSQLLAFLRLSALDASAPDSVLEELAGEVASAEANIMAALRKGVPRGGTWPLAVEIAAMEALVASCQVALGGYQTTLQEDEAVLAGVSDDYLEDDGEQRVRVLAATALRVGERRVLLKTDYVARAELRELRAQAAAKEGKAKIDLGNNMGGEKGNSNPIRRLLNRIVRP